MTISSPGALDARAGAPGRSIKRGRVSARLRDALQSGSALLTAGAGFGKTTTLEQALSEAGMPVAWISCSDAERAPGTLLLRVVNAVADAAPGASDALAERLSSGLEPVDALAATRELIAELSRLLVEPLVLVIDDAEHLDGAVESQRLLSELLRLEAHPLHVAVASRRPLMLRVAKPRSAGRLVELGTADLAFSVEECTELLQAHRGAEPSPEQVDSVMEATEGWPLGIALAAGRVDRGGGLADLSSAPDLRAYLSEELLESLEPELRAGAIQSSIVRVITPEVARALQLPEDFGDRIERSGLLVRRLDGHGRFAYHPLLREVLSELLRSESGEEERRRLHAAVAPAVAETGDRIEAIEHWLAAESWPEAVAAIEREGPSLLRTSPELLVNWLSLFPADVRTLPRIRMLEGQLEWGAGQHEQAAGPLREAVAGHRAAGDAEREWLARYFLAEALFSAGGFEEMLALADGWDGPEAPRSHMGATGAAWYKVLALTALGQRENAERLSERLRGDANTAAQFRYFDELASLVVALAAGEAEGALAEFRASIRDLELHDPMNRLPVSLLVAGQVCLDIGEVEDAMDLFERSQREAQRLGLRFVARDAHLHRASLLARRGDLADARLELERAGSRWGSGWRGVSRPNAEAFVAAAGGETKEAVAAAKRALTRVRPGLVCYRVWTALDMAIVLAQCGSVDLAHAAVDEAIAALDEQFPGELGRYHRARLLATRAWLQYEGGDRDSAYETLRRSWEEAGEGASRLARAHWAKLKPVLWQALADKAIDPSLILPSLEATLPGGETLHAFIDHPETAVRRAAVPAALSSNHPDALSQLDRLVDDEDAQVASVAVAAKERLRRSPLPLRFDVLGRFRVSRAGWEIAEESWRRPVDARLVRFLLIHLDAPVPEDLIIEALWPDLSASSARRSLQVAVSGVRHVVDLKSGEGSMLVSRDRTYQLTLTDQDAVDAEEFRAAVATALAEQGEQRRSLLGRARSLWAGEPLPEERYADWATAYRERLSDSFISLLTALIEIYERSGDHAHAVDAARELVELDPLNEEGHRALISAYARTGRRGHALRQFLECRRALVEELGIEPTEATTRLQARILAGDSI